MTENAALLLNDSASPAYVPAFKPTTIFSKTLDGWRAETNLELGGNRLLRITTRKSNRGGVSTNATVYAVNVDSISTILITDFSECLSNDVSVRCTEKTVAGQHFGVIADMGGITDSVAAFYKAKNLKPWVVMRNGGEFDEEILADFDTLQAAITFKDSESGADVMLRTAAGGLTTEY